MYKIEYGIGLNEQGRPCIELPEKYEHIPEDRFFALEITRYLLQNLLENSGLRLDQRTKMIMDEAENFLGQLGDEVAKIIYEGMRIQGEFSTMLNNDYHIQVNCIEERDALPEKNIVYDNKIYDRFDGLKVFVLNSNDIEKSGLYILRGGILNENWKFYEF